MRTFLYALKYLLKLRGSNIIKLVSITMGLFLGWIFLAKIVYEESYNKMFPDIDRLYRVETRLALPDDTKTQYGALTGPVVPTIKNEFPEIESGTVTCGYSPELIYNDHTHRLGIICTDTAFFNLFGIEVLSGDPKQALEDPDNLFLSRKTAKRIFGDVDPVGQMLTGTTGNYFRVAGIFKDLPDNTDVKCDGIVSFSIVEKKMGRYAGWGHGDGYVGYVKLVPGAVPDSIEPRIMGVLQKYYDYAGEAARGFKIEYCFNPLSDIHTQQPDVGNVIQLLVLLAFSILFVSALNYILSNFSSLPERSRTMAMHKCNGARKPDIFNIMMGETSLLILISFLFTIALLFGLQNIIRELVGATPQMLFSGYNLRYILPVITGVFLLAGLIPANLLANIPVATAYKKYSQSNRLWKQALLLVQFMAVTLMVSLLSTVVRQYNLMLRENPGHNMANMLYCNALADISALQYGTAKQELQSLPFVTSICTGGLPIDGGYNGNRVQDHEGKDLFVTRVDIVCPDYIPTLGIQLKYGSNFNDQTPLEQVIVNEEFVRRMGWQDNPVGNTFLVGGSPCSVGGVVRDFRISTFRAATDALVLMRRQFVQDKTLGSSIHLHVREITPENIAALTAKLKELAPKRDIQLWAYDDITQMVYSDERVMRNMVFAGVFITLVISIIGLFGFINDEVRRRSKEIAIRKVNGATSGNVIRLIASDLRYTVCAGVVAGLGLSYLQSERWLQQFAVKVPLSLWIYIVCGIVVAGLIYAITVLKIRKTALSNPVDSIKKE